MAAVPRATTPPLALSNTDVAYENNPNHNTSPSKVVHCRAVAVGCHETDLIEVLKLFGNIKALKLIPKCSQALVEFEVLESAVACVTYSRIQPIVVNGRRMYVNYSKSTEISRSNKILNQQSSPTNVLLMTIINVMYRVNVDTIKAICQQQSIVPQRIVIFHKNGLQALIEFRDMIDATRILQSLNGCDIYPGCCNLKIEFSRIDKLNVRANTAELYNIDLDCHSLHYSHETQYQTLTPVFSGYQNINVSLPQTAHYESNVPNYLVQSQLDNPFIAQTSNLENLYTSTFSKAHVENPYMLTQMEHTHRTQTLTAHTTSDTISDSTSYVELGDEEGCVAMVHGINNDVLNCNHLFNLFCLYGNIVKIKILDSRSGIGMIQYADKLSTEMAVRYLNNLVVFNKTLQVSISNYAHIEDSQTHFDGSSIVHFQDSRNNRFKPVPGGRNDLFSRIHPPSRVLHYFNAPPDWSDDRIIQIFKSFHAGTPFKQLAVSKPGSKSSSGLVEFSAISEAVEALMMVSHVTLRKIPKDEDSIGCEKAGAPFTFKLAFSSSESINTSE